MIERIVRWSRVRNTATRRALALVIGGLLFVTGMPALLYFGGRGLDRLLGLGQLPSEWWQWLLGAMFFAPGMVFALWSVWAQHEYASGTPLPMAPTDRLLAIGPFHLCRNPMTLGTLLAYLGLAVWFGSPGSVIIVALFGLLLMAYLKFIEEKELAARFGEPYLAYKRETPFMIPRFRV